MPLFNKRENASKVAESKIDSKYLNKKNDEKNNHNHYPQQQPQQQESSMSRPKLVFHCQQAHGSPTGLISGFTNVRELYQRIAECYEIPATDILFCTLNTHKVDMSKLLGGQIGLDDFIFVHLKGRPKEIEIEKTEDALGLTITDNGAGYAFIKRIRPGSVIDQLKCIEVGDHMERIENVNLVGKRHYEVAKLLKEIPIGSKFMLRLVEPLKDAFVVGPKSSNRRRGGPAIGNGKSTLRFKSNGTVCVEDEDEDDMKKIGIEKINQLLDSFLGINDTELATTIWDLSESKKNSMDFADAIDSTDLEEFGFTDDFVIELWGAITDARSGRKNSL